jgi:hypothetical protein
MLPLYRLISYLTVHIPSYLGIGDFFFSSFFLSPCYPFIALLYLTVHTLSYPASGQVFTYGHLQLSFTFSLVLVDNSPLFVSVIFLIDLSRCKKFNQH